MEKLLDCKNISVSFDGKTILDNVSFSVSEGDFLCIVGQNGAGKTTLTNAILGLVPLSSGEIILNGITHKDMGYLPQKLKVSNNFPASVKEVVMSGFVGKSFFAPFYSKSQKCKACDSMRLLGIEKIKNKSYAELSGGQQQKVLLARAICAAERIVFLDEPISGLDISATDNFYNLLSHLNSHHDISVAMVSHDINTAVKYCSKILHLGDGVEFFGDTADYLKSEPYNYFVNEKRVKE